MQSIKKIIRNKPKLAGLERGVAAAQITKKANEILSDLFGPEIVKHAQALHFKNGVLAIGCLSTVAAQEIKLYEKKVISRLNEFSVQKVNRIQYLS